jgi:hypothetical protein
MLSDRKIDAGYLYESYAFGFLDIFFEWRKILKMKSIFFL